MAYLYFFQFARKKANQKKSKAIYFKGACRLLLAHLWHGLQKNKNRATKSGINPTCKACFEKKTLNLTRQSTTHQCRHHRKNLL